MTFALRSLDAPTMLLALLFCGHIMADFLVQTEWVAREKVKRRSVMLLHGLLTTLTHLVLLLPFWSARIVLLGLLLGLLHLAQDSFRAWLEKHWSRPLLLLFLDQSFHAMIILVVWILARGGFEGGVTPIIVPGDWLAPLVAALIIAAGLVLDTNGGTVVVRKLLERYPEVIPQDNSSDPLTTSGSTPPVRGIPAVPNLRRYAMGRTIGVLERTLLFIMVLFGQWGALGLVLAAKSIARAGEFRNRNFAEYYLIGTLASTLVAIVTGLTVVRIVFIS